MTWLWAGLLTLFVLLLAALLCPVRYGLLADKDGAAVHLSLFGGLWKKDRTWGTARVEAKASTPEKTARPAPPAPSDAAGTSASETEEKTEEKEDAGEDKKNKPGALAVLSFAWDNGTVPIVVRALRRLWRHSRPGYVYFTGRAGLGDPMETGVLAGVMYAAFPGCTRLDWDFTDRVFEARAEAGGRIIPLYIIWILGGVLAAKPVRRTWSFMKQGEAPTRRGQDVQEALHGREGKKETV